MKFERNTDNGKWTNKDYYFVMEDNGHISYDLPWFDYGDYYSIQEDGIFYLFKENQNPKDRKKLFRIESLSNTSVTFFCYKDKSTHTLYKN